jgi:membrane protein required for colicin V production
MENIPVQAGVLDLIITGLVLLFTVRGLVRGVIPELGGVLSVVSAVIAAGNRNAHDLVRSWFASLLPDPGWADLAAYIGVFLVLFVILRMFFQILERLVSRRAPGWIDRGLGGLAGAVKGLVACTLILVCLAYTAPESGFRRDSLLAPGFNSFWSGVSGLTGGSYKLPALI